MSANAFHLAILRSAALLVPGPRRKDWLAEWLSELWHVQHGSCGASATSFCMGAIPDAFWLRRNGSPFELQSNHGVGVLSSPARCLSVLACLGALCFTIALLLPAGRNGMLYSPLPGNLFTMAPAGQSGSLISRQSFEVLKAHSAGRFTNMAFYAPEWMEMETPRGKRNLRVTRTGTGLLRILNISFTPGKSGSLVLSRTAWHRYFDGDPRIAIADVRWNLPAGTDAWLVVDDETAAASSLSAQGFAVTRLRRQPPHDSRVRLIPIEERSLEYLPGLAVLLTLGMLLGGMTSNLFGSRPLQLGPRRGVFLTAKIFLVLPIVIFGSLDLVSLGQSVSPLFLYLGFFSSVFAARWIIADQRQRCPVCLRLLANPVRMGEPSRILLQWHGTELICLRGHGMLYIPEWPAIWSARQRWMSLGASWGGLFP